MLPAAHTRSVTSRGRPRTTSRSLPDRPVERASLVLLRSAMDDSWRPDEAAVALLHEVRGRAPVLRVLRARLSQVMLDRPTPTIERALMTLDSALSAFAVALEPAVPTPSGRRRHG